jgi:peptidoglycan/xylan/chitin deacetylase (PgdA/CDA1 family)
MTIIPVLLYHSVDDRPRTRDRAFAVSRAEFEAHAAAIRSSGRSSLRISELAAGLRGERVLPERALAVTFDDGFANTYEAVETLLGGGIASTVYVPTGSIGQPDRLAHSRLWELANATLVEVGAHSVSHPYLDELDSREVAEEVGASKAQLEQMAGVTVSSFSYPHGAYDRRVREAVIAAGYRSAVAVKNALSHTDDDPFAIARWTVMAGTPASRVAEVLEGQGVPRAWAHERLRTVAFRIVRRGRRRLAGRLRVRQ